MTMTEKVRAYRKVQELVAGLGGNMEWRPMGKGGDWELELHGKKAVVTCRDQNVNSLDDLYEPKRGVQNPKTWADYEPDGPLKEGAFWKLIELLQSESR